MVDYGKQDVMYPTHWYIRCIAFLHFCSFAMTCELCCGRKLMVQPVTIPLQEGDTALAMASQFGHEDTVRVLLQSGAKDIPNKVRVQYCLQMEIMFETSEHV